MLVGDDPEVSALMDWEKLKEQNWGQTSLVRSGHKYPNLFNKNIWKGNDKGERSSLNGHKLQTILRTHRGKEKMTKIFCPWVSKNQIEWYAVLNHYCNGNVGTKSGNGNSGLIDFLNNGSAENYFKESFWKSYGEGWQYLALLTLLNLWTDALSNVYFDGAAKLFSNEIDKFKLEHLMSSNGRVIYLDADNSGSNLKEISYHSGGMWTVQLCPNKSGCSSEEGLNLTVGNGKFCISEFICFSPSDLKNNYQNLKSHWEKLNGGGGALWSRVFKSSKTQNHLQRLIVSLVVACFDSPENVVVSVQKPSKEGQLIFKLMEEKK